MKISVGIPTKGRYDLLAQTLISIALQTLKPHEVIIVDDNDEPIDLRNLQNYNYIFKLFDQKKIGWRVLFGQKKGQHYSHQLVQNVAEGDYIFRIDDDCIAEADVLENLSGIFESNLYNRKSNLGAVAPAVLMPDAKRLPPDAASKIDNLYTPNIQWFISEQYHEDVDHLYSCFLYKKGIAEYELSLSTVAHREETIFSHRIKRAGYGLFVLPDTRVWHFRNPDGGIRAQRDSSLWEHDDKIFQGLLAEWKILDESKIFVLDCGLGDHIVFKKLLPELIKYYERIKIYACFPFVFDGDNVELGSIQEAKDTFGNIDRFNIYKYMIDTNHKTELIYAFRKFSGI